MSWVSSFVGVKGAKPPLPKRVAGGVGGGPERPDAHRKVREALRVVTGFKLSRKDFSIINLLALPRAPRRSRPPPTPPATRLGKGGFAPFTPTKEETHLTDKPKFEGRLIPYIQFLPLISRIHTAHTIHRATSRKPPPQPAVLVGMEKQTVLTTGHSRSRHPDVDAAVCDSPPRGKPSGRA